MARNSKRGGGGGGYVYVMSNAAMPGIVKIGKTTRDPRTRLGELSRASGVPLPFHLEGYVSTRDPRGTERELHEILAGRRLNRRREFFEYPVADALRLAERVASKRGGLFSATETVWSSGKQREAATSFLPALATSVCGLTWAGAYSPAAAWIWGVACAFSLMTGYPRAFRSLLGISGIAGPLSVGIVLGLAALPHAIDLQSVIKLLNN